MKDKMIRELQRVSEYYKGVFAEQNEIVAANMHDDSITLEQFGYILAERNRIVNWGQAKMVGMIDMINVCCDLTPEEYDELHDRYVFQG